MTTIAELDAKIAAIQGQIAPLAKELQKLQRQKSETESRLYIEVNKIKRADVEISSGDDKPWFGIVYEFGRWLRTHGKSKPWAEWNGRIYRSSDLMCGKMPESPALTDHLSD